MISEKNNGMAFQITDDTLDYCSNDLVLGKNTGDDFRRKSFPSL